MLPMQNLTRKLLFTSFVANVGKLLGNITELSLGGFLAVS